LAENAAASIQELAEILVAKVTAPLEVGASQVHTGASIGISMTRADCGDVDGLLRRANIAMHAAKCGGGDRAVWFDNSMESVLKARNDVEAGLRRGIPLGEFVPYYQPQIELETGRLCGFEVLARWQHPAGGVVGPELFIPVSEETGLIGDLFDSVFRQALSDARSWGGDFTLAVNVSPGQLKDPWLAHRILKILTEANFPPERVEIEITESSLFENLLVAQSIVASLKNQGLRLALDDFGTGYSSLSNLRALPFDRIKIDRSFVQSMSRDAGSQAIVTAVTSMSRSLGVPVTAEGVEDPTTEAAVRALGCDKAQGWLYGKALSSDDTRRYLDLDRALPDGGDEAPEAKAAAA
jgi:predicted signal transduction protein with EAL and GGDEF domain